MTVHATSAAEAATAAVGQTLTRPSCVVDLSDGDGLLQQLLAGLRFGPGDRKNPLEASL